MIVRFLGVVFRAVGRIQSGERGHDLEEVGEELGRLARPPAQPPAASR